ncbi:hypothetical protein JCM16303_005106 [Sporobolomyces ruberrimus]
MAPEGQRGPSAPAAASKTRTTELPEEGTTTEVSYSVAPKDQKTSVVPANRPSAPTFTSPKKRVARNYDSDSSSPPSDVEAEAQEKFLSPRRILVPSTREKPFSSPPQPPASSSRPSCETETAPSPSITAIPPLPPLPPPSLKVILKRGRSRHALCKTLVSGESALAHLVDFASLAFQLSSTCPISPASSCLIFPSTNQGRIGSGLLPTTEQGSQAISTYFREVEPSVRLFPSNQSRQFLAAGCTQWWNSGASAGGIEWQALYLATVAASRVVSTDEQFNHSAQGWLQLASRMVFEDLHFASSPTLNSLRTLLLVLHSTLLGDSTSLNPHEVLAYFPILVSAAFELELNFDPDDLDSTLTSNEREERRSLWWHIVKLETVWSNLLQNSRPTIDVTGSSVNLPRYHIASPTSHLTPNDALTHDPAEMVLRLMSRLSRFVVNLSTPPSSLELHLSSKDLLECERSLSPSRDGSNWKVMVHWAQLRLQALGEETRGIVLFQEAEWSRHIASLLQLVGEVTSVDRIDRLPMLLFILQGAAIAAIRLESFSPSQQILRLSLSSQLHNFTTTLRTTPWPTYMHQFVKRGVIVVEDLTSKLSHSPIAVPVPSTTCYSPDSSRSTL